MTSTRGRVRPGLLDLVEWLGNRLPDPVFLFIGATVAVVVLSAVGHGLGWSVQPVRPRTVTETIVGPGGLPQTQPKLDASGRPVLELVPAGDPLQPRNMLTADGLYWLTANLVRNFINFAPLGVVLVSMLGIGVAERVGLFAAAMRALAGIVPPAALTPVVIFTGVLSNIASDAGYIILPPLAAALYAACGRPPLAGVAAAFAGVSAGFSANLVIAGTDTLMAPLTELGARVLDPHYTVLPTCNWYFMAASTFVLTAAGWAVTARIVEPRLARGSAPVLSATGPEPDPTVSRAERRGLIAAGLAALVTLSAFAALLLVPGSPLHGTMPAPAPAFGPIPVVSPPPAGTFTPADPDAGASRSVPGTFALRAGTTLEAVAPGGVRGTFRTTTPATLQGAFEPTPNPQPRWSVAIVPLIFVGFLIPGIVYGVVAGAIRAPADVSRAFIHSMGTMAPILAMAFFAAQFIESFRYTRLDAMLANAGGKALVASGLPAPVLLVGLILMVSGVNILMSSMSAKWAALSAILVPMLMMAGLSPELTQAAYRVGDSVTNTITPLNAYLIVILAVVQRYHPQAGLGNLIAMMVPYSACFLVIWSAFLVAWVWAGVPLGPDAPLWYIPAHQ